MGHSLGDITVLTLVPNAGDRLARCLESVRWADRVFCVVDERTDDGSDDVAREYTDWVVRHEYVNAAAQRNWALPQIETEWTLVLDADEWVSEELRDAIQAIVREGGHDGYDIKRDSYFFGKLMRGCGWQRDYNLRLFRTAKGRYLDKKVHSKVVVEGGDVGRLEAPMYHDTYRNFDEYFRTFHRFTSWGAEDAFEHGKRARVGDLTVRPMAKFLKMYLLRQGYRDGYHGAVLSGLGAFSVFMKYAKLWDLQRKAAGGGDQPE